MQLLSLKVYLLKLNKYKANERRIVPDGKIIIEKEPSVCHEYLLSMPPNRFDQRSAFKYRLCCISINQQIIQYYRKSRKSENEGSAYSDSVHSSGMITSPSGSSVNNNPLSGMYEYSMADRSFIEGDCGMIIARSY